MVSDCKSVGLAFAGSSPARPTSFDLPGGENSSPLGLFLVVLS